MMWLALIIVVICLIAQLRSRKIAKDKLDHNPTSPHDVNTTATALVAADTEDDELIAVITAAIHQCTGTGDFEVVSIKPSGANWTLVGRQSLLRN